MFILRQEAQRCQRWACRVAGPCTPLGAHNAHASHARARGRESVPWCPSLTFAAAHRQGRQDAPGRNRGVQRLGAPLALRAHRGWLRISSLCLRKAASHTSFPLTPCLPPGASGYVAACTPAAQRLRADRPSTPRCYRSCTPVLVCVSTCTQVQAAAVLGERLAMCARSSTPRTASLCSPQTLSCGTRSAACSRARP
jgi:hypothetical protein